MKYQQVDPHDKNKYEENIKKFIDDLDNKIAEFEQDIKEVEESSKENIKEEIARLKSKKIRFEEKARAIKNVGHEKWALIYSEVDSEVKEMSSEISKLYDGLKKGFSYMLEKMDR